MKRILLVFAAALVGMLAGIVLINEKQVNTDVTQTRTKVGALLIGERDDRSYNQSHYEALERTAQELNLDITYVEKAPVGDACVAVVEEMIQNGCEIIVGTSFEYGDPMMEVAEQHPEISFFHATGLRRRKNLSTFFGRVYQMRYLSGIVAGLQTQTNEIGYVAAFPISEVNRGINAFTLGVRSVNPDAVVCVEWCDSWTDDESAGAAMERLTQKYDIDVVAMHTDSVRILEMAEEKGIWSIGYNVDNSELFPNTFLTAPVWQWDTYYKPYILKCLQGKMTGENYWGDASEGIVALAPLTDNVKAGTAQKVEEAQKKLESGTFDVFNGPVKDNEGVLRIGAGENMSDYAMLNEFDWYIEGVVLYENEGK